MMSANKVGRWLALALAVAAVGPFPAGAGGYRAPDQDSEAIGRANAFTATADNPSAIYYNPAGLTQLEGQYLEAGVYAIVPMFSYSSPTGAAKDRSKNDLSTLPELYYVFGPRDFPLAFGLGVYMPYGLKVDWGASAPFRTVAQSGSLIYASINPVVAWRVCKTLSLGLGPDANYSQASLRRGIGVLPGDQFKVSGDGWAPGFNAGALWQPWQKLSFGVNYRLPTTIEYSGTSSTSPSPPLPTPRSTDASIRFPQYVVGGISFRPTPNWNLEFDLEWTDWGTVRNITFTGTAAGTQVLPLNFQSSLTYEFGVTRQLGKGYYASAGYFFGENASPDRNFTPAIPDSDLHVGCLGFGRKGRRWDWAVAYQLGYTHNRTVSNDVSPLVDGSYHVFNNAINLSGTFKF